MCKQYLNEDGTINFSKFNLLRESEKAEIISRWSSEQQMAYLMQNTISEEECFTPIFKLIKATENMKKNGSCV